MTCKSLRRTVHWTQVKGSKYKICAYLTDMYWVLTNSSCLTDGAATKTDKVSPL